jgi:prefoldin subunit 5
MFSNILFQAPIGGEYLLYRTAMIHLGFGVSLMTVEEEIEMLEGAKEHLEIQTKSIETGLQKLKAQLSIFSAETTALSTFSVA